MVDGKVSISKISGIPDSSGWSHIYEFDELLGTKFLGSSTRLIILVSGSQIIDQNQIDTLRVGRDTAVKLKTLFENSGDTSNFESLKKSITELYKGFPEELKGIEIIAVVAANNNLFISMVGGGVVYSYQNNRLHRVILQESGSSEEISLSGKVDKNLVFVGTHSFAEKFNIQKIEILLSGENIDYRELADNILSEVRGRKDCSNVAVTIFQNGRSVVDYSDDIKKIEDTSKYKEEANRLSANKKLQVETPAFFRKNLFVKSNLNQDLLLQRQENKRTPLIIGLLFLVALTGSIVYGINKKKESDFRESYTHVLEGALHNVSEATEIYKVNRQKSRSLFSESLNTLNDLKNQKVPDSVLQPLALAIDEGKTQILGEYASSNELFLDTALLSQDFLAKKLEISDNNLYVTDLTGKIIKIEIESKRSSVVLGSGQLPEIIDFDVYQDITHVLTDTGIYEIIDGKDDKKTDEGDTQFRMTSYDGNLYVLDKVSGRIWKYVNNAGDFSEPIEWTVKSEESQPLDFSDMSDWKIDGAVWILKENGEIIKLVQGKNVAFKVSMVIPEVGKASGLFVDKNLADVYLVDPKEKRMAVIDKEKGEYIAQYALDGISSPQGVAVFEDQKTAFILSEGKLYSIDLLHLE